MKETVLCNSLGENITPLFAKLKVAYEEIISRYSFMIYQLDSHEIVYIIEDSFIIYLGLVDFSYGDDTRHKYYRVVFNELLENCIFKFNYCSFLKKQGVINGIDIEYKRFHGIWGEPIRDLSDFNLQFQDELKNMANFQIAGKADYVNNRLPQVQLKKRYEQWSGHLYNFIIYELNENDRTGYAFYCSDNPMIHKVARQKANQIEWTALETFVALQKCNERAATLMRQFLSDSNQLQALTRDVNCDNVMLDLIIGRIEHFRETKEKKTKKKNISYRTLCYTEYDLKYFWVSRYIKSEVPMDYLSIGAEILEDVWKGEYKDEIRYDYIIPDNKWKSEQLVYELTKKLYTDRTVIYQHRPYFLKGIKGQLSYDVFICGINVAIEYQGKQHFEPIGIFGGIANYEQQVLRDEIKRKLSIENGIVLVYINYWEDISIELIKEKVNKAIYNHS